MKVIGTPGNDTLDAADGVTEQQDFIFGLEGNDTMFGLGGDDSMKGGGGHDTLTGGPGGDKFVWLSTDETGDTQATADRITDFDVVAKDRIVLSGIDANVYAAGNQAFTFIGTDPFSGTPGEIRYYHAGGNTYIELQTGTSPDAEGVIRLDGIRFPEFFWFDL